MHNRKMFLIIFQKESHIIIITALKKIYIYMHIYMLSLNVEYVTKCNVWTYLWLWRDQIWTREMYISIDWWTHFWLTPWLFFLVFGELKFLEDCKKCFLFHLKSSFGSPDIQILYFPLPLFLPLSAIVGEVNWR